MKQGVKTALKRLIKPEARGPFGMEHADRPAFTGERNYAFLCGCGRSGTTALVELVNRHPDIAIGYERYSHLAQRGEMRPAHFEAERFSDFRPEDSFHTGYVGQPKREPVLHKIHAAPVVGDKIPTLFRHLEQLEHFPNPRVVFIIREPFAVANSFVARARNPVDAWPADHTHADALDEFNEALAAIEAYVASDKPALIVNYAGLFLHRQGLDELWRFLGVDAKRVEPLDDIFDKAKALESKNWINAIGMEVACRADFHRFRHLLGLCAGADTAEKTQRVST